MRTLYISLQNKYFNQDLKIEKNALNLLNENSVFPDEICILSKDDKDGFIEKFSQDKFQAVFISGSSDASFSCFDLLKEKAVILDENGVCCENRFVSVLPKNLDEGVMEGIIKKLQSYLSVYHQKVVFKLFGVEKSKIEEVTSQISAKYPCVFFNTQTENLNSKTVMLYDSVAPKIEADKAIKEFILTFKTNIYAEDDVTLEKRLVELLKLRRLSLSTAESMTGGNIASHIVKISGASEVFYEGAVVYNTQAKESRLDVQHLTVQNYGVVSSEVAYEMAEGLLKTGRVNTSISITGYATREEGKPSLFYIGIGYFDSVEVYKYELYGTRCEVIEMATSAALFLMIKTIYNA